MYFNPPTKIKRAACNSTANFLASREAINIPNTASIGRIKMAVSAFGIESSVFFVIPKKIIETTNPITPEYMRSFFQHHFLS